MTQHDFEANLKSLYAQQIKFDNEQEFESQLARRFERRYVRRIAVLWIFGALGVFSSCYWIGAANLFALLSEAFDFFFASLDSLSSYSLGLPALIVTAAMYRRESHRSTQ